MPEARTFPAPRALPAAGLVLAGLALVAVALGGIADRREQVIHVALRCTGTQCSATVAGGEPLRWNLPEPAPGRGVGLYCFAPWEGGGSRQVFRHFALRDASGRLLESHPLMTAEGRPFALLDTDWSVRAGVGALRASRPGERSVVLLAETGSADFALDVDLVRTSDAGVVFHAADPDDGRVLAVRPRYNDVLYFALDAARPGPIRAIAPLRKLTVARELVRLAALAGRLALAGLVLAWILRRLVILLPGPARAQARPERSRPPAGLVAALACVTFVALACVAHFGLAGVPHLDDETAYLFQAKIFAGGRLWAPPPPVPDFFMYENVVLGDARWFAKYPPLFPALLSVGVLLGAPWLVNPALGAFVGLALFGLARELTQDWRWALVAWGLLLTSPFFLIMGGTMMSHVTCALLVTLCLWQTLVAVRGRRLAHAALAGGCLGLTCLARPYTALLVACAVGAYGLAATIAADERRRVIGVLVVIALAALPFAGGYVLWNELYTGTDGSPLGLYTRYDATDRLGFGPDRGADWLRTWGTWGHTPAKALRSVHQYLEYTSNHLLGWPAGLSFALVLAALLLGRPRAEEWLMAGVLVALAAGHMLYWATQHLGYGARYWFSAVPALMALSAVGLRKLTAVEGPPLRGSAVGPWAVAGVMGVLVLSNLAGYLPRRLHELPAYGGVTADLPREVERRGLDRAVVFVKTQGLQFNDGFFMNDPLGLEGAVFARDLGERNAEVLARFPDRPPYRWDGHELRRLPGDATERR